MGRVRRSISAVTGAALVLALIFSISWWYDSPRPGLEPAATVLALVAAIAGIPAERWAAARERRVRALRAVRQEVSKNREILEDSRFADTGWPWSAGASTRGSSLPP